MGKQINHLYEFGKFRINVSQRLLEHQGKEIPLPPKVFNLLLVLVERRGQVVSKDELMAEVWPDAFVEESNLKVNISTLRKALGSDGEEGKYIETLHKRGYRFIPEVTELFIPFTPSNAVPDALTDAPETVSATETPSIPLQAEIQQAAPASLPTSLPQAVPGRMISRRLLALSGWLLALTILAWVGWSRWGTAKPQIQSLAILPFGMLGEGPDDEHLGLGLADALITRLTNSGNLAVRPTGAVQKFTAADRDPVELGRRLQVDAVLDGNLQRSGERVRLTVQLLNTRDGKPLWAESFEEQVGDLFALQRAVAERLGNWLTQKLSGDQSKPLRKDYTANSAAFEAYTHGRYFYSKQTSENYEKALRYYQQAIEFDPNYALAWTGIADCYYALSASIMSLGTKANNNFYRESRAAAERAIALDESLAEAHLSLGTVLTETDYPAALRELERTLELNPNHAHAHNVFSVMLLGLREFKRATFHAKRACNLDPLAIGANTNLGMILFCDHHYDEAVAQLRKTLELDANLPRARYFLGATLGLQGRTAEAIAELQKAIELSQGGSVPSCSLAYVYAAAGRRAEAQEILTRLLAEAATKPAPAVYLAMVYVALGDREQAFFWLEKTKGTTTLNVARADPRFDPIRTDPRFVALLAE